MTIVVSGPVLDRLAGVAAALAAETGKAVSYGEVIAYLLGEHVDG